MESTPDFPLRKSDASLFGRLKERINGYPKEIWALVAAIFVLWVGRGMVTPFVVIFFTQIVGLTGKTVGTGIAIASLIGIAIVFFSAGQIDKRGGRPILMISIMFISVATMLYAWAESVWFFIAAALVLHISSQSYWPAIDTVTTSVAHKDRVITSMSILRVAMALGIGVGGFVGGIMVAGGGLIQYRIMFMAGGLLSLSAILIIWLSVPNRVPERDPLTGKPGGSWREVFADRLFLYSMLLLFALVLGFTQVQMSVPPFLRGEAGVSEGIIGTLFLLSTILVLIFQVPVAARVDRGNAGRLLALGASIWGIAFLLMILTVQALPFAFTVFLAFTLGELLFMPVSSVLAVRLAPGHLRGRYFAMLSFTWGGSFAIATLSAGVVLDTANPIFLWPVMASLMFLAALGAYQLRNADRLEPPVYDESSSSSLDESEVALTETKAVVR